MKKILFLATMVATLFASCQKENFAEPTIEATGDFTATFAETRTELDGTAVVWCEEDLLTIFTKTSHNRKYQVKELSEDGRTATFGYVSFTGSNDVKITSNYALYPYDADATLTGGVVTTTLQPTQTYNGANGNLGYALMAAQSATNNFSFRNAGSLLRFKLSKIVPDEFTLNSIKVASASNNIAGKVTINLNNTEAKAIVTSNGVKEITLTDINYEVTTDVEAFYIAMPSMSFADKDLTVTFVFEEGEKVFELPAFDLEQGKIKSITYEISDAEDFTGGTPDSDENPEPMPMPADNEIWYTTTDGAKAKLFLEEYVMERYGITHTYNETLGVWVLRTSNVKWTEFPNIDTTLFDDPSMVNSIYLPNCIETINGALRGTRITSIKLPTNLKTIGDRTFEGCSYLASITIPNGVTSIGSDAFASCSKLYDIVIPNSVTSIGSDAFARCSKLYDIVIPNSIVTFNLDCLGCGDYDTMGTHLISLTIGSGVEQITGKYLIEFGDVIDKLYLQPNTPPTNLKNLFYDIYSFEPYVLSDMTIFVPIGSESAYKQALTWDDYNLDDIIIGINY